VHGIGVVYKSTTVHEGAEAYTAWDCTVTL